MTYAEAARNLTDVEFIKWLTEKHTQYGLGAPYLSNLKSIRNQFLRRTPDSVYAEEASLQRAETLLQAGEFEKAAAIYERLGYFSEAKEILASEGLILDI